MSNAGLRIETAASVIARNFVTDHFAKFGLAIRRDRAAGQAMAAAYIDALSGSLALVIAGGHGSRDEVLQATIRTLRESVDRDLKMLKVTGQ